MAGMIKISNKIDKNDRLFITNISIGKEEVKPDLPGLYRFSVN